MPNTFLTSKEIARQALPILENNLVMGGLVYRDLDATFAQKGDTIQVRKPAAFTAVEFDGDLTGEFQAITETAVDVKLDKIASVDVEVTSKELTLEVPQFQDQVIMPAMAALGQKIDSDITSLYKDIPYAYGAAGTTPDELADIAGVRKVLNENKVPLALRRLVIDPEADAKFNVLDVFAKADASGTTLGLREAALGRKLGFDMYMDQNIKAHTAGGYAALLDVTITAGAAGATAIKLESTAGASTAKLLKGDRFTIDGIEFVVTADTAAAVSGDIAVVNIYPALPKAYSDFTSAAVTFTASHVASMAFHRNAFALVSRPLLQPMGGADSYSTSINAGINIRVTMDYNMTTKTNIISFDALYGVKTLYPELAARLLG